MLLKARLRQAGGLMMIAGLGLFLAACADATYGSAGRQDETGTSRGGDPRGIGDVPPVGGGGGVGAGSGMGSGGGIHGSAF